MNLHRKTIVITGASSGIGAEIARLTWFKGARVIGLDRNDPMSTLDGFIKIDMGDTGPIDAALAALPGRVDALVNAAGVSGLADRDLVARVNYRGPRYLTEALVPTLANGGAVVNVTSILGVEWPQRVEAHKALAATTSFAEGAGWLAENPVPQDSCYQYFKEALVVWTKKRGHQLFMQNDIRMNAVAPGPVFTPVLGELVQMLGEDRVATDAANIKRPPSPTRSRRRCCSSVRAGGQDLPYRLDRAAGDFWCGGWLSDRYHPRQSGGRDRDRRIDHAGRYSDRGYPIRSGARKPFIRDMINSKTPDLILTHSAPETVNLMSDACEAGGTPCLSTAAPWEAFYFGRGGKPDAHSYKWNFHFSLGVGNFLNLYNRQWSLLDTNRKAGALIHSDADGNAIRTGLLLAGWEMVDPGPSENMGQDFTTQIDTFKSAGVEIVVYAPFPPDFPVFWRQAAQRDLARHSRSCRWPRWGCLPPGWRLWAICATGCDPGSMGIRPFHLPPQRRVKVMPRWAQGLRLRQRRNWRRRSGLRHHCLTRGWRLRGRRATPRSKRRWQQPCRC